MMYGVANWSKGIFPCLYDVILNMADGLDALLAVGLKGTRVNLVVDRECIRNRSPIVNDLMMMAVN